MSAGDVEVEGAEEEAARIDFKCRVEAGFAGEGEEREVGVLAGAVGDEAAADAGEDAAEERVVDAGGGGAVEGDFVHELDEAVFDVGHVAVAFHVFAVEVGDDGEDGGELEEGAVAFVGFGDEVVGGTGAGVGAEEVDATADDDGGVEVAGGEDGGDHACGRCLSVHAGDGDAVLEAHELGEHFGAGDDGNFAEVGFDDLGVVRRDGGGGDDDVGGAGVFGAMALEDDGAEGFEAVGDGGAAEVGAGDGVAEGEEDFRDAAHADAADADEVDALHGGEQGLGCAPLVGWCLVSIHFSLMGSGKAS